ncbi:MAG: hypothetical protein G5700_05480, partial [Serratia symbiotica]|nr:hypothetical protein [Serratia symbiotica]
DLCIKQDAARRYARKCTPCLKAAHSRDYLFQIRFIQQSRKSMRMWENHDLDDD